MLDSPIHVTVPLERDSEAGLRDKEPGFNAHSSRIVRQRILEPSFVLQRDCELTFGGCILRSDCDRVREQCDAIVPKSDLMPGGDRKPDCRRKT